MKQQHVAPFYKDACENINDGTVPRLARNLILSGTPFSSLRLISCHGVWGVGLGPGPPFLFSDRLPDTPPTRLCD